ncbi:hypothetical protein SPWS13_3824 [Shewanella putrefaciens]|nr:hypothetical protein SPWS13_3824 [Shewanella putrefaciens]
MLIVMLLAKNRVLNTIPLDIRHIFLKDLGSLEQTLIPSSGNA